MEKIPDINNAERKVQTKEKERIDDDKKAEQIVKEAGKKSHFHILVVDDSPVDRKFLEKLLETFSHRVTSVDSALKALEYLGIDNNPDQNASASNPSSHTPQLEGLKVNLIMTDYSMSEMNGYQLLICLKNSEWKDVPVVIMSSENIESRISECLKEGAERFLIKPLTLSDIQDLRLFL